MYHLKALFVGALVLALGGVLLVGPAQLGMALTIAVICTAGLGLIPILLVSYLVGLLVLGIAGTFSQPSSEAPSEPVARLVRYMRKARSEGLDEAEIKARAFRCGWSWDEIHRAGTITEADG